MIEPEENQTVKMCLSNEAIDDFKNKGFVAIRQVLDQTSIDRFREDLMRLIESAPAKFSGREINLTSDGLVNSLHNLDSFSWSRLLLGHPDVLDCASALLNDQAEAFGSELFAKPSGTGVPVPEHQDDFYWCISDGNALTIWFALSRSDEASGAVYYYPGSHRKGVRSHEPSGVPGSSQRISDTSGIDPSERVIVTLEPGDCVIHHARTIHGSGPNNSGHHRLGLTVRFKGARSSIDLERKDRYLSELKTQLVARGQE